MPRFTDRNDPPPIPTREGIVQQVNTTPMSVQQAAYSMAAALLQAASEAR